MDEDTDIDHIPSRKSPTPPASLNSITSSDKSVSFESDEAVDKPSKSVMLKRMFRLPVTSVCRTEMCKNLMIYLRNLSHSVLVGPDCVDLSHIDNDKCVEFFRNYIVFLSNTSQKNLLNNISQRQYLNFIRFSLSIWNFSDKLEQFCVRMVALDVHIYLIRFLGKLKIAASFVKSRPYHTLLLSIVGILHNINNKLQYTRSQYRDENLISYLLPIAALDISKDLICLKTGALLLLAFLVNENENSSLNANDNHIIYILDILTQSLSSPKHYSKYHGYHCLEILHSLRHIASPDSNKQSLIRNGILPLIEIILNSEADNCSEDEVVAGLELLWSLSFSGECIQAMNKQECNLRSRFELLVKSDNKAVLLSVRGIMWNIETQRVARIQTMIRNDAETPNLNGHVMISYNHGNQEIMIRIKDALVSSGYTVWMDLDHMGGNFVDAMADGIEQASVLLLGMCQAFKNSPHCRQEVKYAYTLGIPFVPVILEQGFAPDGWLGLMCATLIYTEFIDSNKFDNGILQLHRQLGSLGKTCNEAMSSQCLSEDTISPQNVSVTFCQRTTPNGNLSHALSNNLVSIASGHQESLNLFNNTEIHQETDNLYRLNSNFSLVKCEDECTGASNKRRLKVLDWSLANCQLWLSANGICTEDFGIQVTMIDGPLLFELAEMRITAPQAYYTALKSELNFNFINSLRLSKALRSLDNEF